VSKTFRAVESSRSRLGIGGWGRSCQPLLKRIVYILAFVHLGLAGAVIFHVADPWLNRGWWQRPLSFWGGINYSLWRFGFFSPDVGKSSEIEFNITHKDGRVDKVTTLSDFDFFTANRESLIRFYGFRVHSAEDPGLQDLCARSVVVYLLNELGTSQDVSSVDYTLRSIRYPTMAGFRAGEPVATTEFYRTTFVIDEK
jgi:hypothetical protein